MASKIVTLKDHNNDIAYPITPVDAVFVDSNTTLSDELNDKADTDMANIDDASITSNKLDWSTLNSGETVEITFANSNSRSATKFRIGANTYMLVYHGSTGVKAQGNGYYSIRIGYPTFSSILCAQVQYTVSGQTSSHTGHATFQTSSADTYYHSETGGNYGVFADLLIIGTIS